MHSLCAIIKFISSTLENNEVFNWQFNERSILKLSKVI